MAFKLSPELLTAKFVQSATGRVLSPRSRRILTLLLILICTGGTVLITHAYIQAFRAIPKYQLLQSLKRQGFIHNNDDNNPYGGHIHKSWHTDGNSFHNCTFYNDFWHSVGLSNATHTDSVNGLFTSAENIQIEKLKYFLMPLYLIVLLFVLPWVILRAIFWVIDADKSNNLPIKNT